MHAVDSILTDVATSLFGRWDELPGTPRRVRQTWVVRLAAPPALPPDRLGGLLSEAADEGLASAEDAAHLARLVPRPEVHFVAADRQDVIIQVNILHPAHDEANSWLVVSSWVLRRLDTEVGIVSIYGIPRRYWPVLQ